LLVPNKGDLVRQAAAMDDRDAARRLVDGATEHEIVTTGAGLDLSDTDLSGLNLRGMNLRRANLNRACLHRTVLADANLSEASLICPGMERTDLRGAKLDFAYVHALAAQVCNFNGASLTGLVDGTGSLFHGCAMQRTAFSGARLAGATFYQCDLTDTVWEGATLQGMTINECLLEGAQMVTVDAAQLTITKSSMNRLSLRASTGAGCILQRPTAADDIVLDDAKLPFLRLHGIRGARLTAYRLAAPGLDLANCVLPASRFDNADIAGARVLEAVLDGSSFRHAHIAESQFRRSSLLKADFASARAENMLGLESLFEAADFTGVSARAAVFRDCNLSSVKLSGAYLYRGMLTGDPPASMSLADAQADGINLVQAYVAADCSGASLRNAKCAYARLNQSSFRNADLSGANIYQASMVKTDFTGAQMFGVEAPFFADRCLGLEEALQDAGALSALESVRLLKSVTSGSKAGST
jgi:uncharacterized protein YjbI with pentapeptide repeats